MFPPLQFLGRRSGALALVLSFAGLALCLLLAGWAFSGRIDFVVGCGGASGCQEVLGSRWGRVLQIPVALPGAACYGMVIAGLLLDNRRLLASGAAALASAALWFIALQVWVLRAICPWCMASHLVALLLSSLLVWQLRAGPSRNGSLSGPVAVGLAATALLALIQVFGSELPAQKVVELPSNAGTVPGSAQAGGAGRKVTFLEGTKVFDCDRLPRLGSASATHVMVEYFDYTCDACRTLRGHLHALVERYPDRVAVLLLPTPMERACNPHLPPDAADHRNACEAARLALAVWKVAPELFPAVEEALWAEPGPDIARARGLVERGIPRAVLTEALADPWLNELIRLNAADVARFSDPTPRMPKLLFANRKIAHGLPPDREAFLKAMRQAFDL